MPPLPDISTANALPGRDGEPTPVLVPALTLASHPVSRRVGERLLLSALASGRAVEVSRNEPFFLRPGQALGAHLSDPCVSRRPLVFSPGADGGVRVDPGPSRQTAVAGRTLEAPWEFSAEQVAAGVPLELAGRVVLMLHQADPTMRDAAEALGMVGTSVGLQRVRRLVEQVADLDVPVLIRGETGSGKELIARALHARSPRKDKPFVSVNLGAIPRELAAAELFGARKGAFTGAVRDQEGFMQAAHGGTLFLDEVGEAPPEVQVMLLRVLETGEVFRVGDRAPFSVDVRLVAATDAALEQRIQDGRFKAPLLHRLAGFSIRVPPLRERREDIGPLFHHFARKELETLGEARRLEPEDALAEPWLPVALAVRLLGHDWPGNIRQLRNVARQLVIGGRGRARLEMDAQLEQELAPVASVTPGGPAPSAPSPRRKPADIPEEELLATLRACEWDFQAAADRLGIHRTSIYHRIERGTLLRTAGELGVEELTRCHRECGGDLDAMVRRLEVSRRALGRRLKELGLRSTSE
ncbi:sigma 54-interacting transcriptional regulator [Melittangium boletus]|uniref:sigma 54-interacting transcriptional regulator n=1 Tax=Melittangium boletus TaxID=83453 RepID=UPI003DA577C6